MKKIIFAAMLLLGASCTTAQNESGDVLLINQQVPEFSLNSKKFGEINSSELKGKTTLIVLFATWCGPCQLELAAIEETLYPQYKDNKNFKLIVIGREHTDEELDKYLDTKKFSFPIYPDKDKKATPLFATKYIPRTYLIDQSGKVVYTSKGFNEKEFEELMLKIEALTK